MTGARSTLELDAVPALPGLYARGVAGSIRAAASRRSAVSTGSLPTHEVVVRGVRADPTRLTDYQHLVGEPASDVVPAGFLHVLAFPVATALMVRGDFPLPLLGMVHLSNRVEQRRAVHVEEVLDVRVRARDLRAHRSGVAVDLVADLTVDGVVVWRGVSTYLAKGLRLDGPETPFDVSDADGGPARPARPAFEPPIPTGQWRLDADVGRRYAAVSGDRNPIHLSSLAAKALGFPRTIAHGMYTAARALAEVGPGARGDAYLWEAEFAKPVLLPSTVTVRIAPADGGPGDGGGSGGGGTAGGGTAGGGRSGGLTFVGWDARRGRLHLTGTVRPLTP
ncbi:MaoC/PaaZ C-terminal domain-containing protein [Actinotalea sp. K2]|uniref:MaoC/PaaZ C-terminal domain-containing protein n=1 Tax=Actinotalea sp. K2 TaxID=2939438 RepID=UPI002017891D|nr:MaoC/PaaZ C-terminal domain-containing protein [Actinotalea sp. K2]MCL3863101.1 hypothetical protein [Actinotalea sp. K2]